MLYVFLCLFIYRSPSPAPRRRTLSESRKKEEKSSSEDIFWEQKRNEVKAKELQRVNQDKQEKKTRFESDISEGTVDYKQLLSAVLWVSEWGS